MSGPGRGVMAALVALVAGAATPALRGQVYLRDRATPLTETILAIDAGGVTLGEAGDRAGPRTIGWHRVRSVEGVRAAEAEAFLPLGDAVRRGAARLDRGDLLMAGRALEAAYARGAPRGPTGAVLTEAVLRLRVLSRRPVTATLPWLEWAALATADRAESGDSRRGPRAGMIDLEAGLAPRVAPIFSAAQSPVSLAALLGADEWSRLGAPLPVMAACYRAAAEFEVSGSAQPVALPAVPADADDALKLVHAVVRARVGDGDARAAARGDLAARLRALGRLEPSESEPAPPEWMAGWLHAAIGRSLLLEPEPGQQRLGVVELLHVPARFADTLPELSRLALADAASALRGLGEHAAAAVLDADQRRLGGSTGAGAEELDLSEPLGLEPAAAPVTESARPITPGTTPARGP